MQTTETLGDATMIVHYGIHPSPFGECLIAVSDRGICHVAFTLGNVEGSLIRLAAVWSDAELRLDNVITKPWIDNVFSTSQAPQVPALDLRGTPFQKRVWVALLAIPRGHVTSYGRLAAAIGHPKASRAVGTAVGDNPVAVLIPCHRVVRKDGSLGGYYYGPELKSALLRWEGALR
jgi:AraC family transcriptional regulator of adaptative response/methylated-DNA-[protein]-cysteine methyltransferase